MSTCKICLEEINDFEQVYAPCNCRGSLNYIHIKCFNEAYLKQNKSKCEICNINFPLWTSNIYIINSKNTLFDEPNERTVSNFQNNLILLFKKMSYSFIRKILNFIYHILLFSMYIKTILFVSNLFQNFIELYND
jgi:hypothetical protein